MAKELPFFKFEIAEWMFGRIQKQPQDIQGMFINICCKYWHKLGEYAINDLYLDFDKSKLDTLFDSKIIDADGDYLVIKFLDAQLHERTQNSKIQRIKGLKSAELRAKRKQASTGVQPNLTAVEPLSTSVQPNSTEEKRREEKRKEDTYSSAEEFWQEVKSDGIFIERLQRMVISNGFRGCTTDNVLTAVYKFIAKESAKPGFTDIPRQELKKYLVNWINKLPTDQMK